MICFIYNSPSLSILNRIIEKTNHQTGRRGEHRLDEENLAARSRFGQSSRAVGWSQQQVGRGQQEVGRCKYHLSYSKRPTKRYIYTQNRSIFYFQILIINLFKHMDGQSIRSKNFSLFCFNVSKIDNLIYLKWSENENEMK